MRMGIVFAMLCLGGCERVSPPSEPSRAPTRAEGPLSVASSVAVPSDAVPREAMLREAVPTAAAHAVQSSAPAPVPEIPGLRRPTEWGAERSLSGVARMAQAERLRLPIVKELFAAAATPFPPRQLLFRAFKRERLLEVWASARAAGPLTHITSYEICYASGGLGPKRHEGDRQVPEGFYRISLFNPASSYHLAMLVSYPNDSDRVLSDPRAPGSEIMIHGSCVSIGCLAMSDERAEELWLMARAAPAVSVHLFPTRDMDHLLASAESPEHHGFWRNLREGLVRFEEKKELPSYRVEPSGRYRFF